MALVEFRDVTYEIAGKTVLSRVNFSVEPGETLVLLGRSGSGKTTALKMTNGMLFPTSGQVLVEDRATTEWDPIRLKRRIGYVIQEVGLFPHFTVGENVGLVPKLEGRSPAQIAKRVNELLTTVGLAPAEYRARYPRELSGGQRQRVGVARALAADPTLLLFDEPFGALDPVTRTELHAEFHRIQKHVRKTVVVVTHDMGEAFALADRIGVVDEGAIIAFERPDEIRTSRDPRVRRLLESIPVRSS
jgi:osmoprotectant transport system ATP-binding protein